MATFPPTMAAGSGAPPWVRMQPHTSGSSIPRLKVNGLTPLDIMSATGCPSSPPYRTSSYSKRRLLARNPACRRCPAWNRPPTVIPWSTTKPRGKGHWIFLKPTNRATRHPNLHCWKTYYRVIQQPLPGTASASSTRLRGATGQAKHRSPHRSRT